MVDNIIQQHPIIEALFASYASVIGTDTEKYRNHVYRIFNYTLFLSNNADEEKYAIAAFFHDVGIWTNNTFDYLQPSIELAKNYLQQSKKANWSEEIAVMIDNHHKTTIYKGNYSATTENFRKADWTDVSLGLIHFYIPSNYIKQVEKQFPYKGFHLFLTKLFTKNLFQHPLKPLPMFKK
ncbi:MAG TPA: HD domain-containing protein [Chitinophagales bacterium]|nr:HD domain-containing protein [Chitinophagales bacterium]